MTFTGVPLLATGDWIDAAWGNTYWRDNFAALWPYSAAGDLAYGTGAASNLGRLAKVTGGVLYSGASAPAWLSPVAGGLLYGGASAPAYLSLTTGGLLYGGASTPAYLALNTGGVLYGGASAPAWLAKPSSDSVLLNTSAGTPSWLDLTYLRLKTATLYNATGSTYNSTVERDLPNSSGTITPAVTSTLFVIAKVVVSNGAGNCWSQFALSIDGTTQNFVNFNYGDGVSIPAICMGRKTGVAAGARTIKLREKEGYGAGVTYSVANVEWFAIAIPE